MCRRLAWIELLGLTLLAEWSVASDKASTPWYRRTSGSYVQLPTRNPAPHSAAPWVNQSGFARSPSSNSCTGAASDSWSPAFVAPSLRRRFRSARSCRSPTGCSVTASSIPPPAMPISRGTRSGNWPSAWPRGSPRTSRRPLELPRADRRNCPDPSLTAATLPSRSVGRRSFLRRLTDQFRSCLGWSSIKLDDTNGKITVSPGPGA